MIQREIMPSKIRLLDELTINKIAAGEVIESPASVVKELVENSLDAGATEICVEIKSGGRQLIRITDNGCGMNRDDALLCLERHATSKIKEVEDIQSIFTMGFRGEAIPSIASISKFTLLTAPQDGGEGTVLIIEGGKILQCGSAVRSPGTTIEVKSLFFNVPVRRKFQKSPVYDANEILKMMTLLSLGHPQIKFQLIDNQKNELQTGAPPQASFKEQLKDRIAAVMSHEFVAGCYFVDKMQEPYSLQGYIGNPSLARVNRSGQYLFINHRAVFSPLISYLIREAYGTTLPTHKHPVFVLHLSLPGEVVDVNVHPQKKEVRIRQEGGLKDLVLKGIQEAIHQGSRNLHPVFNKLEDPEEVRPTAAHSLSVQPAFSLYPKAERELLKEYEPLPALPPLHLKSRQDHFLFDPLVEQKRPFPRVLGTISNYILLESSSLDPWKAVSPEALCLVDQKNAHARVIFENLQKAQSGPLAIQSLLVPYALQLTSPEASVLRSHLEIFNRAGIQIHEVGAHSFMIDAIPQIFGNIDMGKLVIDLLSNVRDFQENDPIGRSMEKKIAKIASQAAINGNKRLQIAEAQGLINQLFSCETPFLCPYGKSVIVSFTAEEIAKKFQKGNL